jgi:hypothetical protein
MTDTEELRERLQRATGDAYGGNAAAAEIAAALEAQYERWQIIAEIEQERGTVQKLGQDEAQCWTFEHGAGQSQEHATSDGDEQGGG